MRKNIGNVKKMAVIFMMAATLVSLTGCAGCNNKKQVEEVTASNEETTVVVENVISDEVVTDTSSDTEDSLAEATEDTLNDAEQSAEPENPNEQGVITYEEPVTEAVVESAPATEYNTVAPVQEQAPAGSGVVTNRDEYVKVDINDFDRGVVLPYESMDPNIDRQGGTNPYSLMVMTTRTYYNGLGQCADIPGMYCLATQKGEATIQALQAGKPCTVKKIGSFTDVGDVYYVFYGM